MELDPLLRQVIVRWTAGLAFLLFALVLAILSLLPNAGIGGAFALIFAVLGLALILDAANEFRKRRVRREELNRLSNLEAVCPFGCLPMNHMGLVFRQEAVRDPRLRFPGHGRRPKDRPRPSRVVDVVRLEEEAGTALQRLLDQILLGKD